MLFFPPSVLFAYWNLRVEACLYRCKLTIFHSTSYGDRCLWRDWLCWCSLSLITLTFRVRKIHVIWLEGLVIRTGPNWDYTVSPTIEFLVSSIGFIWNFCPCQIGFCDFYVSMFGVDFCPIGSSMYWCWSLRLLEPRHKPFSVALQLLPMQILYGFKVCVFEVARPYFV